METEAEDFNEHHKITRWTALAAELVMTEGMECFNPGNNNHQKTLQMQLAGQRNTTFAAAQSVVTNTLEASERMGTLLPC